AEVGRAFPELFVPAFYQFEFFLELVLLLVEATFLAFDLFAAVAGFSFPGLTELDLLFFARDYGRLPSGFSFSLGVANDSLCRFLGCRFCGRLALYFIAASPALSYKEKRRGGEQNGSARRSEIDRVHFIWLQTRRRRRDFE